jgi:hypothetical protein
MTAQIIGSVKSASGKTYEVKYDERDKTVYVSYAGWTNVGSAQSVSDAMRLAEAWLYNK